MNMIERKIVSQIEREKGQERERGHIRHRKREETTVLDCIRTKCSCFIYLWLYSTALVRALLQRTALLF